mgnify:CR=1 FL=1
MSDFWRRVDEELEFKGMNRAFLAKKCDFSLTNIGQGIKLGSTPSAETAVKIAQVLGVSVEYLITGFSSQAITKTAQEEQEQLRLYRKYHELLQNCEKLSVKEQNAVKYLAQNLAAE